MNARKTTVAALLALSLLAPALLPAAVLPPLGRERPDVVADWQSRLVEADEALKEGEWKRAKKITSTLLPEMCDRIESGEGAGRLLALAALFRAVAEAGLGNLRDAQWDFGMAQALHPPFSEVDLTSYGEPGKFFDTWRYEPLEEDQERYAKYLKAVEEPKRPEVEVTAPRKLRAEPPKYPYAKRRACLDGPVIVQMTIDEEGRTLNPRLLKSQDPVLGLAAMDPIRKWRFEPARREGKPVKVYYNLSVNFQVPICANPLAVKRKAEEGEEKEP